MKEKRLRADDILADIESVHYEDTEQAIKVLQNRLKRRRSDAQKIAEELDSIRENLKKLKIRQRVTSTAAF